MAKSKYLEAVNVYWSNIFKNFEDDKEKSLVGILKDVPLFKDLSIKELKTVAKVTHMRTFEEGEFMFETGQPGAAMFVIISGIVKIVRETEDNEYVELATLEDNDFIGELALLDNSPRSASALIKVRTSAFAIFREDLNQLIETHPILGSKIMKQLAITIGQRLKATNDLLMRSENKTNE